MIPKPDVFSALLWFLFSGTAFLSAFILPIHLLAFLLGYRMNLDPLLSKMYFGILFFAAAYHGLYRVKTLLKDLGSLGIMKHE